MISYMSQDQTMPNKPDFLKRHPLVSSVLLLLLLQIVGHALWLLGYIPDNNKGGEILYGILPVVWFVITVLLVGRKFL
jgi:hypothetical protein